VHRSFFWSCRFHFCSYCGRAVIVYVRELQIFPTNGRTYRCPFVPQRWTKMDASSLGFSDFRLQSSCFVAFVRCPYLQSFHTAISIFSTHWLKLALANCCSGPCDLLKQSLPHCRHLPFADFPPPTYTLSLMSLELLSSASAYYDYYVFYGCGLVASGFSVTHTH